MKFTEHLAGKVQTTAAWKAEHEPCLAADGDAFTTEPFKHPDGTWFWLVCLCGAKHLCNEADRPPARTH